jgi:hypothetical protein
MKREEQKKLRKRKIEKRSQVFSFDTRQKSFLPSVFAFGKEVPYVINQHTKCSSRIGPSPPVS